MADESKKWMTNGLMSLTSSETFWLVLMDPLGKRITLEPERNEILVKPMNLVRGEAAREKDDLPDISLVSSCLPSNFLFLGCYGNEKNRHHPCDCYDCDQKWSLLTVVERSSTFSFSE